MTKQKKWLLFWWCFLIISFMQHLVWRAIEKVALHTSFFYRLGGEEHSDNYEIMFGFGIITILCTILAVVVFAKFFYKTAVANPFNGNKKMINTILTLIGATLAISFICFNLYDASLAFTGAYAYENLVTTPIDYLRIIPIVCHGVAKALFRINAQSLLNSMLRDFFDFHLSFYIFTGVLIATLNGFFRLKAKAPQVAADAGVTTQVSESADKN